MASKKKETAETEFNHEFDTINEIPRTVPRNVSKENVSKDIDFVINEVKKLSILSDPKNRRNKTISDILSLSHKVSSVCLKKLEDIKSNL